MRKGSARKGADRRKKSRTRGATPTADSCYHCSKALTGKDDKALFVEEEVGRIFCSEGCIAAYFTPEIDRLEKGYFQRLSPNDLAQGERESMAHLRWITLQEPDEVWREKTLTGDFRYTLVSEFMPGTKKVWCVCICLFLKGEPSFLYLAFPTSNSAMVNHYRRGERVQWVKPPVEVAETVASAGGGELQQVSPDHMDRLADAWTEDETYLANMSRERGANDIPAEEYGLYDSCLEETLQDPDEVWSLTLGPGEGVKLYHFIRHYPDERPGVWFVIVARETENEEQIEIMDAFPTKDATLVENYRQGEQEIGQLTTKASFRMVH